MMRSWNQKRPRQERPEGQIQIVAQSHCKSGSWVVTISEGLAPLTRDSVSEHRGLWNRQSGSELIRDIDYAFAYTSQKSFESDAFIWDIRSRHGIDWDVIQGGEMFDYEPNISREKVALITRMKNHGGVVDPGRYVSSPGRRIRGQRRRLSKGLGKPADHFRRKKSRGS